MHHGVVVISWAMTELQNKSQSLDFFLSFFAVWISNFLWLVPSHSQFSWVYFIQLTLLINFFDSFLTYCLYYLTFMYKSLIFFLFSTMNKSTSCGVHDGKKTNCCSLFLLCFLLVWTHTHATIQLCEISCEYQ